MTTHKMPNDTSYIHRAAQANNRNATGEELLHFIDDEDPRVRIFLALNLSSPPDLLEKMREDINPLVRAAVAANASAKPDTLAKLVSDRGSPSIQYWLAVNPSTLSESLAELASHSDSAVRSRVAINPKTPAKYKKILENDENEEVREKSF